MQNQIVIIVGVRVINMKKIFIFIIVLILLSSFNDVEASLGCMDYGMAYEDFSGYCKCMSGYVWGTNFLGKPYCISGTTYCYDKYGYNSSYDILSNSCECGYGYVWDSDVLGNRSCVSCFNKYGIHSIYSYLSDSCECMSGYVWGTDFLGKPSCVSGDSACKNDYGYGAKYDSLTGKCKCSSGYVWGTDILGKTECISTNDYCEDKYGFNARYNSLSDKCECQYGYELTLKKIGSGLECVRCSAKYGINSSYNSLTKKCECDDDYTLEDDGKCVEKQHNVYFILKEVNTDERKAIIKSEYDFRYYLVTYSSFCYSSTIRRYLNNQIVVNLGTDYEVDVGDNVVLFNDNEVCNINSVKKVSSSFTLEEKDEEISFYYIPQKTEEVIVKGYSNFFSDNTIQEEKTLITKIDKNLSKRVSGNILLQVEKNGEGWYVYPDNQKKYYLGRPADAFSIMRNLGLGIKHSELNNYLDAKFPSRLSGKIMLDVEQNGEAYYINPDDLKAYYLSRPSDAFRIMRELGLGITNDDVRKIDVGEVE